MLFGRSDYMQIKEIDREKLIFASYYKKTDLNDSIEIAPFIVSSKDIPVKFTSLFYEELSKKWKIYKNIFDEQLISIVDNKGRQNKNYKLNKYFDRQLISTIVDSTIIINDLLYSSEVILKMPEQIRLELLQKDKLIIKDILTIYDFVCANKELLGFNYEIKQDNKVKKKRL